ncbi:DarT ssDNA thymidine ADP-ribosyltransferase family protein [Oceanobacillus senegalensis]|uniref:DarT ssDNA thymidine ADP-ribosyltransferase family protein n=1 Tax=Oceanobacillus senegalensis TaxID=1936063 RepID=UPI000A30C616|nr:DarT ssDNA thymidine ADP-ribosyltransferase family protein [Oceanobacillus senegalensis]
MKNVVQERAIESFVKDRDITTLVHFTRIENLSSIFSNGLLPIDSLSQRRLNYINNDEYRLDNCLDANCVSIQFPNYQMFYKYRDKNQDIDWVVLGIKKKILWEKDCAFCVENAASGKVVSMPLDQRKGVDALKRLYYEYPGKPTRNELNLKSSIPTHPQAEVLVFDKIEPELIWGVAFVSEEKLNQYSYLVPSTVRPSVEPWLYSYRHDFEHWRL